MTGPLFSCSRVGLVLNSHLFPRSRAWPGLSDPPYVKPKRGAIMVVVLVCLAVTMIIGMGLVRLSILRVRNTSVQEARIQATSLANSAILRASAQLQNQEGYTGETWEISSEELAMRGAGRVEIRVVRPETTTIQITAAAQFPLESADSVTVTTTVTHVVKKSKNIEE